MQASCKPIPMHSIDLRAPNLVKKFPNYSKEMEGKLFLDFLEMSKDALKVV